MIDYISKSVDDLAVRLFYLETSKQSRSRDECTMNCVFPTTICLDLQFQDKKKNSYSYLSILYTFCSITIPSISIGGIR
ncbi:hypothetical protein SAMN04487866_10494 [Thermoactinomyces sp. DSM 45891]|nr:hypothetical protein SAMN04487866_10494 [Thermoactinomyces sp. DSM 45891]